MKARFLGGIHLFSDLNCLTLPLKVKSETEQIRLDNLYRYNLDNLYKYNLDNLYKYS